MILLDWFYKALFYILIQVADRLPRKKPFPAPLRSAGPSAPEVVPELPYPGPHKVDPVTPDRPYSALVAYATSWEEATDWIRAQVEAQRKIMERHRQQAIEQEIAEMLGPVKEGDPR
jgi:hypothetical protein